MRSIHYLFLLLFIFSCEQGATTNEDDTNSEEQTTVESDAPQPNEAGVIGQEVSYETDSTTMNGYLAYSNKFEGPRPGVLVIHEWWGHNDYARSRADMLAELGYVALAVDMYGDGQLATHPDDAGTFAMSVMGNIDVAKARFEAALGFLRSQEQADEDKMASIGYCFGGSVSLAMANAGYDLDAVAAFHSGLTLPVWPESTEDVKAKILVCNGADDPFIAPEHITDFNKKYDDLGIPYEYIAYEGAVHAFTDPGADAKGEEFGLPLAYNEEADVASWEALQAHLAEAFE
ncbi:MAG: dienelactone hydrolase family protein [Bacteroidota bacterium]